MWMKVLGVILFGILGLALLADLYVIEDIYDSAGRAVEHSIDAGIVRSGIVTDAQHGFVQLEQHALKAATQGEFIRSLKLDSNMENKVMKNSQFDLELKYDTDGIPWVEVVFKTQVSFSLPDIEYPVTVTRKIAYGSMYK